jgi:hypothetical protein
MAFAGQFFTQIPQPMQPAEQASRTALPLSLLEHLTIWVAE